MRFAAESKNKVFLGRFNMLQEVKHYSNPKLSLQDARIPITTQINRPPGLYDARHLSDLRIKCRPSPEVLSTERKYIICILKYFIIAIRKQKINGS